jgi:AcrR family transcriptional regulator
MATARRVGKETSATRQTLLDAVEQLMLDKGYAAVTYRAVAARADVTSGLVQYYFPTLDDLFVATIRRRGEENLARLTAALDGAEDPLRVLWEHSSNEATAALTAEFMALGNHRKSIRAEITDVTSQVRKLQFDVLAGLPPVTRLDLSPEALLYLVTAIPKLLLLEEGVGIDAGHAAIVAAIEEHLSAD